MPKPTKSPLKKSHKYNEKVKGVENCLSTGGSIPEKVLV
jgi:hypothetical protein